MSKGCGPIAKAESGVWFYIAKAESWVWSYS